MRIRKRCILCQSGRKKLIQLNLNETLLDHLNSIMSVQIKATEIENKSERFFCDICTSIVEDFYECKSTFIRNVTALMNLNHFDDMDIPSFIPRIFDVYRFWNSFQAKEREKILQDICEPADPEDDEDSILEEKALSAMLQKEQKVQEHVVDVVEGKKDINKLPPNQLSTKTDMDQLELLVPITIDLDDEDDQPLVKPTEMILYECRYCPFSGYNRRKVTVHEKGCKKRKRSRSRSRSALAFTCAECYTSETFASSSELKKHVTNEHRLKYPCRLCTKIYNTVNERSWHEAECSAQSEPNGVRTRSRSRLRELIKKDDDERTVRSQSPMSCVSSASSRYSKKSGKSILSTKSTRSMKSVKSTVSFKQRGQSYNHPNVPPPARSVSYPKQVRRSEYRESTITPEPVKVVKKRRDRWIPVSNIISHQVYSKPKYPETNINPLRCKAPKVQSKIICTEPTTVENRATLLAWEMKKIRDKPYYTEYKCLEPKCEFDTDCLITLTKHDIRKHGSLPYFICLECKQAFTKRTYLQWHKASKHARDPYFCHRCFTIFQSSRDLEFHLRMHNIKRFPCTICDLEYTDNSALLNHWKNMNDVAHRESFDKLNRVTNMCIRGSHREYGYMKHLSPNHSHRKIHETNEYVVDALSSYSARSSRCDSRNSDFAISEVMSLSGVTSGASTPLPTSEFDSDADDDDDGASSSKKSSFSVRPSTPFPGMRLGDLESPEGDPSEDTSMTFENHFTIPVFKDNQLVNEPYEPPVAGCSHSN